MPKIKRLVKVSPIKSMISHESKIHLKYFARLYVIIIHYRCDFVNTLKVSRKEAESLRIQSTECILTKKQAKRLNS